MYEATKTLVDEFAMAAMQGDWASNYSRFPGQFKRKRQDAPPLETRHD